MTILSVTHLTKTFGGGWWPFTQTSGYTAVNNISFTVGAGEIVGFLGANGAGKTTTIQMLLGTLEPTSGTIKYFGQDLKKHRSTVLAKVGYASGYDRLPPRLTVWENLDIIGRLYGLSAVQRAEKLRKLLPFFGIWHLKDRPTGPLSAGQITRVMLVKAFMVDPDIVLLDEPTASLDPDIAHEVRQFILAQRQERNVSLLITSHNMEEVTQLCDRVLVMRQGVIIADNTPETLARSTARTRVHLVITQSMDTLLTYLAQEQYSYTLARHEVTVELEEHGIAPLLADLARYHISYSHIAIDKPTLQDYFLSITASPEAI